MQYTEPTVERHVRVRLCFESSLKASSIPTIFPWMSLKIWTYVSKIGSGFFIIHSKTKLSLGSFSF